MEPEPQPPEDPELAAAVAVLADVEGGAGAAKTLATLVKNLVAAPDNPKYRRVRTTNPKVRAALLDVPGGEDFLRVLGFAPSLASDEHAAGTFLEISEAAAVAVQAERGPAALAALQRVARVERVANNTAQPVAPASAPAEDAPGVEMLSKKHPTVEVSCAAAPRNSLSLQEAVAWCRSLPDCKGMWYYDNGRCCPKASWDAGTFTKEIPGGAFYRVGPAAPQAAAAASQNYIAERDADEFNIRIVAAKVRPQHYIIVSVKHPDLMADGAELVLHVIEGDNNARCHFPPLQDGSTQLIVNNDDILLTLMTSLSAEIFIR